MDKTGCTIDYLLNVCLRRLQDKAVLTAGELAITTKMMTNEMQEPWQIILCPINAPNDKANNIGLYGSIQQLIFHVYYRHRNMLDGPMERTTWLADANVMDGYYSTLKTAYDALVDWWPQGDLADEKAGKLLTTVPLVANYYNEPREKWADPNMGEGMFEIRCRFRVQRTGRSDVLS